VLLNSKSVLTEEEQNEIKTFGKNRVVIGTNCWLQKVKGLDLLIRALVRLPERICLFLVGEGEERTALEHFCEECGVANRVLFAGEKLAAYRYLPYYDIFVLASHTEGFSLSLLEAALYGKPCVSSDLPDIQEKFSSDEVVFFPKGDVEGLVKAILIAEGNTAMGERARKRAESSYSVERFYQKHIEVYES
jgi:glycosyltransferase involved in cell wall biosynthesis